MTCTMRWSLPFAAILAIAAGGVVPADAAEMKSKQPTVRCDCTNCSAPHCPRPGRLEPAFITSYSLSRRPPRRLRTAK